jgi:hypothetical protein
MYFRRFCITVLLALSMMFVYGQKVTISGYIIDSLTRTNISAASIRNVFSGVTNISNKAGRFFVDVQKGNILAMAAAGYYSDTLTITDSILALGNLVVLLKPLPSTLPGVTVTGRLTRYQADSIERRKAFVANTGNINIPAVGRANDMGFGIALNLDRFGKKEKSKHKAYDLFEITEQDAYVNYRWNEVLVYKYTKLEGDSLTRFIQQYRPTEKWLRQNLTEEDLVYYINKQLKRYFRGLKD